MLTTLIQQERIQELLVDGSLKYSIVSTVTDKGELPYEQLFVYQIVDSVDPKDDVFQRVGNPYDLENVNIDRSIAIVAGDKTYLSSELRREYSTLSVAVEGKDAIDSRINDAVKAWYTYITEFTGTDTDAYPTTDPSYEQALKDTYAAAKEARKAAEEDVGTKESDLIVAGEKANSAAQLVLIYKAEVEFCQSTRVVNWSNYFGAVNTFKPASVSLNNKYQSFVTSIIGTYNAQSGSIYPGAPVDPAWTSIWQALNTYQGDPAAFVAGALATFQSNENYGALVASEFATFCGTANTNYVGAINAKAVTDKAVSDAVTAKEEAEATLATAQEAEDTALAAVMAVCPDFNPLSV